MVLLASHSIGVSVFISRMPNAITLLSDAQTTGSIAAASNILTVADASRFILGDWVIIETGGEAGAGARGTKGVGGTWPALSYANAAAMNADTSQANFKACWLEDTGDVYHYTSGVWTQVLSSDYYLAKAIPKALSAQITAIDGDVLTLSANASAAATNANVYFDNWGIIQEMCAASLTVTIPAGTFATSCHIYIDSRADITISGAGQELTILKTPKGAAQGGFYVADSGAPIIEDLQIDTGFKNTGYSMRWLGSRVADIGAPDLFAENYRNGSGWGDCIYIAGDAGAEVRDCIVKNPPMHGLCFQFTTDAWARRCTVRVEDPYRTYTQWMIQFPDVYGGGAEDCTVDADWLTSGFNCFKSQNVSFLRCTGRNAIAANNASEGALFEDLALTFEDDCKGLSFIPRTGPIIEFSTNVSGGFNTAVGRIVNPTFIQENYTATGPNDRMINIVVTSALACPVEVSGTYDTDAVTPKGLIWVKAAPGVGSNSFSGIGLRIGGGNLTCEGIRFKGTALNPASVGMVHLESAGTVSVTNCIFDGAITGSVTSLTQSGNQTNAEYEA